MSPKASWPLATVRQAIRLVPHGHRRRGILLVGLAIFLSGLEAIGAVLIFSLVGLLNNPDAKVDLPLFGNLGESLPTSSNADAALNLSLLVSLIFLARGVAYLSQSYWQSRIAHEIGADLGARLLHRYLRMPLGSFLQRNSAELIRNAHLSTNELAVSVFVPVVTLASDFLMICALFTVLLLAQPLITFAAAALFVPVILITLRVVQPRIVKAGSESQAMHESSVKFLQETLKAKREITVLGRQGFFVEQFANARERLSHAYYIRSLLVDTPRIVVETLLVLSVLGLLTFTLARGESGDETVALISLFAYTALRVTPSVNRILSNLNTLRFGTAAIEDISRDLGAALPDEGKSGNPLAFQYDIRLENVSFEHQGGDTVFENLNLQINAGESIGIVGPTGSGKSTLLNLIAGLLEPTQGQIRIDSVPLTADSKQSWQLNIGLVPQETFLLDDTLKRNIALGVPDTQIETSRVERALQLSQLQAFVQDLPKGLETVVGEQGARLSGGQRQRLAIARALYNDPVILIFDEGTSALDTATEAKVMQALGQRKAPKTLIMVAHRTASLAHCDRIVRIENRTVREVDPTALLKDGAGGGI